MQDSGFRVQGAGFRVQGAGLRTQGAGFRVQGSVCRVQGSGSRVQISASRVTGVSMIREGLECSGMRASEMEGFGLQVQVAGTSSVGYRKIGRE
jgi:hypothetical protein